DSTQRRSGSRVTNRWNSRIRARVEHPIGEIKRVFGFTKVCYLGLAKNRHRLVIASALANLFKERKRLPALARGVECSETEDRPVGAPVAPPRGVTRLLGTDPAPRTASASLSS